MILGFFGLLCFRMIPENLFQIFPKLIRPNDFDMHSSEEFCKKISQAGSSNKNIVIAVCPSTQKLPSNCAAQGTRWRAKSPTFRENMRFADGPTIRERLSNTFQKLLKAVPRSPPKKLPRVVFLITWMALCELVMFSANFQTIAAQSL